MRIYFKYILKDIKVLLSKLLAITLIVVLGVGFTLGLFTAAPNMRYSVSKFYKNTNVSDVIIQTPPISREEVEKIKNHTLILDAYAYFSFDEDVLFQNEMHLANINVLDFSSEITVNKLTLVEGRFPNPNSNDIEVVIERKQPFLIDVPLDYETTFLDKKVKVVGIVHSPWYFAFVEEISLSKQRPIEIILYADTNLLEKEEYTNIAITFNNTQNIDFFTDKYKEVINNNLEILKNDFPNYYFSPLTLNQSYAKYTSDVKIVSSIALIFPLFFLLITILVSISSMTRIIEDQRMQIGTLRSLGYNNLQILIKYLIYALLSSGIGTIIGIGLGVYFIPAVIYNIYKTIYNLPPFLIQYYFDYTSVIAFVLIFSVVFVAFTSVAATFKERPAELLRVKTPKPGNKIFLEKITFLWKRLKFKYKSTFRNIFRHKRNLFLTLIGVMGSTALLFAGFGIKDSVELAGKYQYEEMQDYDLEISVSDNEEIKELIGYEKLYLTQTNAEYNKDYISLLIVDYQEVNKFLHFKDIKNKEFTFEEDTFVITKGFADKHNLKVNQKINISIYGKTYTLTITNIQEFYFGNYMYISNALINEELIPNKIYVKSNLKNIQDKENLKTILEKYNFVTKVMFKEDLKYSFLKTSESVNSIIVILVFSACALAIIIYYNITLINIHTRKREIATLKVLGYQEIEVSGYVFRELFFISLFAIILGLILGKVLHLFIISQIVIDGVMLKNQAKIFSYLYTFILALAFLGIVYFITLPETKKINMVEALKSYE